jgi:GNAT superfamily N-acetyltransferase
MQPGHVEEAAAMELLCFPTADPASLLDADDLLGHVERFGEGCFVALDSEHGDAVVGMGCGILVQYDLSNLQHTMLEVCGERAANHDPDGPWYYGTDISVHPDHRGHGIGHHLYELRKDVVRRLDRRGIIAGGHLPGYRQWKHRLTPEQYVERVVAGELVDPTLTMQLHNGFEVLGVIRGYLHDPSIDDIAAFLLWRNPDHRGGATG